MAALQLCQKACDSRATSTEIPWFERFPWFERSLVVARTSEGRKRAQAHSMLFGRPRKLAPHQAREALKRIEASQPLRESALTYAVDHSTISRLARRSPDRTNKPLGALKPGR